jgi:hypothetical protein
VDRASLPIWLGGVLILGLLGSGAWLGRRRWLAWLRERGWLKALKVSLGGAERKDDSADFVAALNAWHDVIVHGDPTPRGIKRFVNRVRFLAMLEEAQKEDRIPDDMLVALAALHHAHVRLPDDIAQLAEQAQWASLDEEFDEAEGKEAVQVGSANKAVSEAIGSMHSWPPTQTQWDRFRRLVENMHVH